MLNRNFGFYSQLLIQSSHFVERHLGKFGGAPLAAAWNRCVRVKCVAKVLPPSQPTPAFFETPLNLWYFRFSICFLRPKRVNFHPVSAELPLSHSSAGQFPDVARDDFFHNHFRVVGRAKEENVLARIKAHIPPIRDVLTWTGLTRCNRYVWQMLKKVLMEYVENRMRWQLIVAIS